MKKVIAGKIKPQLRLDGYYNVLNKYGTQHDSTEYYQWATGAAVTDAELADLYAGNGLFSTIIDAPADDATKNGIDLGIKDKDLQKRLDDNLQTIHYQSKLAKALKWARLFGGSAVVMLVDDGRLLQDPLNWRDVHGVAELLVYGRNEVFPLWINGYENNPDDENYRKGGTGIPEFYQVNSVYGSYVVHSSRCLIFHNGEIPEGSTMANLYRTWGIPEYMRIREELRNASIGPGYSIRLLERLSMVTYKMKNLANVLSTADGDDTVLQRMEMLDLARNLLNMVFIDQRYFYWVCIGASVRRHPECGRLYCIHVQLGRRTFRTQQPEKVHQRLPAALVQFGAAGCTGNRQGRYLRGEYRKNSQGVPECSRSDS